MKALEFFQHLVWLDGKPLLDVIELYRRRIFKAALDTGKYNLVLTGRAKKNWKSADLVLAALYCLVGTDARGGNQCYLLANDEDQAGDDLSLAKKLIGCNPLLTEHLIVKQKAIERIDGKGFLEILPAGDIVGTHGKTYRFAGYDEIHGYKTWDILEALQPDPTRLDTLQWITSYASIFHRPGVPLFDLCAAGKAGKDPKMLFSWYAGDYTTDPKAEDLSPADRANPSRGSWADANYLDQQMARLPMHKYRRLHLNLPGLPEGSAFSVEPVMDSITRGVKLWQREPGRVYKAFLDISGGSRDDATLSIASQEADKAVVALVMNQGQPPPFDPLGCVPRFAAVMKEYGITKVVGDNYGGETFKRDFERHGIKYQVSPLTRHELYEALEPVLNSHRVVLPDVTELEQQLLGLIWRGGKIDHPAGEHDDWANAVAGVVHEVLTAKALGFGGPVMTLTRPVIPMREALQRIKAKSKWNVPETHDDPRGFDKDREPTSKNPDPWGRKGTNNPMGQRPW